MCFRVAIIRITDHFVFQGVEGAEAAAELRVAVSRFGLWVGFGGFWWFLVGSGWVLELKSDNSKIIEIHCEKQCFGLRRLHGRLGRLRWAG